MTQPCISRQQVVQDTVTEAVQEAVAAAFEENVRFDVRANFYTLIAITGVILYWRGIWNSWSVLCCILTVQFQRQLAVLSLHDQSSDCLQTHTLHLSKAAFGCNNCHKGSSAKLHFPDKHDDKHGDMHVNAGQDFGQDRNTTLKEE